jgi:hypothetical protein
VQHTANETANSTADQTVRLKLDRSEGSSSIRIGFTDQAVTAFGGLAIWSAFLSETGLRDQLRQVLPHAPTSPNALDPTDIALSFLAGIVAGADKLTRVARLGYDPAVHQVLGIERVPSQSTFSRFFRVFDPQACGALSKVHARCLTDLEPRPEGYTLDLDSFSIVHEDGHQEGVAVGYTRKGTKPCQRPLVAALAEVPYVVHFRLRPGNTACLTGAESFLEEALARLPKDIHVSLLRADSGFGSEPLRAALAKAKIAWVMSVPKHEPVRKLCRHDDAHWHATDVPGIDVQEAAVGTDRLIVIRQCLEDRPRAGGKRLLDVPGYRFQAVRTNLPPSVSPLEVWRRYNGRADVENRIKELGEQFGLRGLCLQKFQATEAACHLAVLAYNLCVRLQRRLALSRRAELRTLQARIFHVAGVYSHAQGQPTLRLARTRMAVRKIWRSLLERLRSPDAPCNAVESLDARSAWPGRVGGRDPTPAGG